MSDYEFKALPFIPYGSRNAISRTSLSILIGVSDRKVRKYIEADNKHGALIISMSEGYFIPTEDEMGLARGYIRRELKRLREETNKLNKMMETIDSISCD